MLLIVADSRSVLPYNNTLVTGTKQSPYTRLPNKSAADCISSMDASFFINDNTATSQIPPCSDFAQQEEHKDDSYDHSDEDVVVLSHQNYPLEIDSLHQHSTATQTRAQRLQLLLSRLFHSQCNQRLQPRHASELCRAVESPVG